MAICTHTKHTYTRRVRAWPCLPLPPACTLAHSDSDTHTLCVYTYTLHIFCISIAIEMISEASITMRQHQRGDTMPVTVLSLDSDCKALEEIEFSLLVLSLVVVVFHFFSLCLSLPFANRANKGSIVTIKLQLGYLVVSIIQYDDEQYFCTTTNINCHCTSQNVSSNISLT